MDTAMQDSHIQGNDPMVAIKAKFPGIIKVLEKYREPTTIAEQHYDKSKDFQPYSGCYSADVTIFDSNGAVIGSCSLGTTDKENETLGEAVQRVRAAGHSPSFAVKFAQTIGDEDWTVVDIPHIKGGNTIDFPDLDQLTQERIDALAKQKGDRIFSTPVSAQGSRYFFPGTSLPHPSNWQTQRESEQEARQFEAFADTLGGSALTVNMIDLFSHLFSVGNQFLNYPPLGTFGVIGHS